MPSPICIFTSVQYKKFKETEKDGNKVLSSKQYIVAEANKGSCKILQMSGAAGKSDNECQEKKRVIYSSLRSMHQRECESA